MKKQGWTAEDDLSKAVKDIKRIEAENKALREENRTLKDAIIKKTAEKTVEKLAPLFAKFGGIKP